MLLETQRIRDKIDELRGVLSPVRVRQGGSSDDSDIRQLNISVLKGKLGRIERKKAEKAAERRRIQSSEIYRSPEAEAVRMLTEAYHKAKAAEKNAEKPEDRVTAAEGTLLDLEARAELGMATEKEIEDARNDLQRAKIEQRQAEKERRVLSVRVDTLKRQKDDALESFQNRLDEMRAPMIARLVELLEEASGIDEELADLERCAAVAIKKPVMTKRCLGISGAQKWISKHKTEEV